MDTTSLTEIPKPPKSYVNYLQKLLEHLGTQRAAAQVLLTLAHSSYNGNGHNGHPVTMRNVARLVKARRAYRARAPKPKPDGRTKLRNFAKAKPLPDVTLPRGLEFASDAPIDNAIVTTLQAAKKPLESHVLTAMILKAGFERPTDLAAAIPITRWIALRAAMLAKQKLVKKTSRGWAVR